ncbi:hypothetical protein C8Q72DRAFT_810182, partial [Fomitopsis betulina]
GTCKHGPPRHPPRQTTCTVYLPPPARWLSLVSRALRMTAQTANLQCTMRLHLPSCIQRRPRGAQSLALCCRMTTNRSCLRHRTICRKTFQSLRARASMSRTMMATPRGRTGGMYRTRRWMTRPDMQRKRIMMRRGRWTMVPMIDYYCVHCHSSVHMHLE